jgi:hypothetical protein
MLVMSDMDQFSFGLPAVYSQSHNHIVLFALRRVLNRS